MRNIKALVAGAAVAATAAAMAVVAVAPASAEPINPVNGKYVTPAPYDIVGVGSESTTFVVGGDQLTPTTRRSRRTQPAKPNIYSWDAVPPNNMNDTTQQIIVKAGCAKTLRPNGSSAGIAALDGGYAKHTSTREEDLCRASTSRGPRDPARVRPTRPSRPAASTFVTLARDAVTYSSTNTKGEKTNVPNNLTKAQLVEDLRLHMSGSGRLQGGTWRCAARQACQGASQAIDPILPQAGSGTLSFWALTALGLTADTEPTCGSAGSCRRRSSPRRTRAPTRYSSARASPTPTSSTRSRSPRSWRRVTTRRSAATSRPRSRTVRL